MALFLGALFPERFTRRGIQQDYVVGMGGGAYDYLVKPITPDQLLHALDRALDDALAEFDARLLQELGEAVALHELHRVPGHAVLHPAVEDPDHAGVLQALGSKVTVVALEERVLELFDPMISTVLMQEMRRQGIELRMSFQVAGLASSVPCNHAFCCEP